jgi:hypothetical protein
MIYHSSSSFLRYVCVLHNEHSRETNIAAPGPTAGASEASSASSTQSSQQDSDAAAKDEQSLTAEEALVEQIAGHKIRIEELKQAAVHLHPFDPTLHTGLPETWFDPANTNQGTLRYNLNSLHEKGASL